MCYGLLLLCVMVRYNLFWSSRVVLFVCWALVPADVIESIGITYYPSKVWANAAPAFFCITAAYALTLFFFANLYITNPLSSVRTYKDGAAQLQTRPILRQNKYAVDDIYDIPIDIVNKCLY